MFTTQPVTGNAYTDANIGPITVTEETAAGQPTTVGETVNLSSTSPGTYIFNTAQGATTPTGNTSLTIPNGQSSVTFYYGDTRNGSPTITAAANGLTPATQPETINVGPLASYSLSNPGTPKAGVAFTETITAKDAGGNTVTSYSGNQCLTFNGPANSPNGTAPLYPVQGVCPSGSLVVFTNGVGTAAITLYDAQTTALSATSAFITGSSTSFSVVASSASAFALATPSPIAGTSFTEMVTATDPYGNTATSYGGTGGQAECVTFSGPSKSPNNTAPLYPAKGSCTSGSSVTFTSGIGIATITLYDAQTTTLTVTTTATPTLTGASASFSVATGPLASLTVTSPGGQTAGQQFTVSMTGTDAYGNGFTGILTPTFTGPSNAPNGTAPVYPPSVTFTNGSATASVTLYDAQTTTLKVTSSVSGTSPSFAVVAAGVSTLTATSGANQSATVNSAFTNKLVVTATDAYGNAESGLAVTFAAPASGASATFASCTSNPNTYSCTQNTGTNGQATSSTFTANGANGAYSVTASAGAAAPATYAESNRANQTISFTSTKPSGATLNGATYTVTATATSGLTVTITVDSTSTSICSINGGVVSFNAVGTCTLDANQAGSAIWNPAPQVQQSFTIAKGTPTNVVTNVPASPTLGQSVTFTATVTGPVGGATPSGAVTWTLTGPVTSCASTTGPSGTTNVATYTCVIAASGAGSYSATAAYAADSNYSAVTSSADTFAVAKTTPTNVVTNVPASPTLGQSVTFTATVTGPSGAPTPTGGTVTWTVGGTAGTTSCTTSSTTTLNASGQATCVLPVPTTGTYVVSDSWNGNTNYNLVASANDTVTVAKTTPTNVVTNVPASPTLGQSVTFTATVTGPSGAPTPTGGTVTWTVGGTAGTTSCTTSSTTTLNASGQATCVLPVPTTGTYVVSDSWNGNTNYNLVASADDTVTVAKTTPTNVVTNVPASPTLGQSVTFTATVTGPSGAPTPTGGTVTWTVGGTAGTTRCTTSSTTTLNASGQATCVLPVPTTGTYVVSDSWNGNTNYNLVASADDTVTVAKTTPTNVVTNVPASPTLGQVVTFTATVTGPVGGATPSGAVTWTLTGPVTSSASTTGPSGTTNVATYTCVIAASGAGSYSATAAYAADSNYSAVTSSADTFAVAKTTPTNVVTNVPASPTLGQSVTFTATVTGPSGATTPTGGTVTWTVGGTAGTTSCTTSSTTTLNASGQATCVLPVPTTGTYVVSDSWNGNTNYNLVASANDTVTVAKTTPTNVVTNVPASPTLGQSVTFTATVTGPSGAPTPTGGTVTWTVGGTAGTTSCTTSSTTTLNASGQATCVLPVPTTGTYVVSDSWNGNTNYNLVASANDTVTVQTAPTAVVLANGGTAKKADSGDTATITFNEALQASTICSSWTGTGTKTLTNATITFTNNGYNDTFAATSSSCTGGGNFGTVGTGASYVSGPVTFTNSTISWNPTTDKLSFTLGTLGTGTFNVSTNVTAGFPGYTASGSVTDTSGNAISTTTFTSTTATGF